MWIFQMVQALILFLINLCECFGQLYGFVFFARAQRFYTDGEDFCCVFLEHKLVMGPIHIPLQRFGPRGISKWALTAAWQTTRTVIASTEFKLVLIPR